LAALLIKEVAFISGINVKQFDIYYKCNYADGISTENVTALLRNGSYGSNYYLLLKLIRDVYDAPRQTQKTVCYISTSN